MRIISQDGVHDFNYDNVSLHIENDGFYAEEVNILVADGKSLTEVARYSSEEKADKAMDMLHEAYMSVKRQIEKTGLIHYMVLPAVWMFPLDDDLEA